MWTPRRYGAIRLGWVVPIILFALAAFAPSSPSTAQRDGGGSQDAGTNANDEIRQLLAQGSWKPQHAALDWAALRKFYSSRNFEPAWASENQSALALRALNHADHEGLSPDDYNAREIKRPTSSDAVSSAHFDLLLTNSVLRYAHDVREGRLMPNEVYDDASLPRQHYDAISEVNTALTNDSLEDYFASLPPPQEGYRALRSFLDTYRGIAAAGGWPAIPRSVSTRMGHRLRKRLAERLAIEQGGSQPIEQALRDFQSHHGLSVTGELDEKTVDELNVDVAGRVDEIALNMERWRWLPRAMPARYVEVNVPSASLTAFDEGHEALRSRVVVGRETDPTPLLHADATSITTNPNWEIPEKIARKEILSKLHAHPSYLRTHHIEFVSHSPLRLRQLPGPDNALGALKIDMPNRFNVYLHDTPGQSAFDRLVRDESHGCMRVEQILPLASFALSGNTDAAVPDLESAIATRDTQKIALPSPLPVYVLYWTVAPTDDGKAQFWPDPYGRDAELHDALKNRVVAARISML
jgi:murein L,D-transpeptidase YcbB/YkuD